MSFGQPRRMSFGQPRRMSFGQPRRTAFIPILFPCRLHVDVLLCIVVPLADALLHFTHHAVLLLGATQRAEKPRHLPGHSPEKRVALHVCRQLRLVVEPFDIM